MTLNCEHTIFQLKFPKERVIRLVSQSFLVLRTASALKELFFFFFISRITLSSCHTDFKPQLHITSIAKFSLLM